MVRFVRAGLIVLTLCLGLATTGAWAQGLVWSLPDDGSWVRYAGTYTQSEPEIVDAAGQPRTMEWARELFIRSVGTATEDYLGEMVPARWLEFELKTGTVENAAVVPGAGGHRIYKVLVPEAAIVGDTKDPQTGIPVTHLPVIRGYQKIDDQPAQPLESGVLSAYPLLTLLDHYDTLQPAQQAEDPMIPLPGVQATAFSAQRTIESRAYRSTSDAVLWRSDEVPFGLAAWSVTVTREAKEIDQSRSDFRPVATMTEQMAAQETGTDAVSALPAAQ